MPTSLAITTSILFWLDALIAVFGVLPALYYAFTHKQLPTVLGIKLLSGPFESLGIDALIVAGLVYFTVCVLKIVAGYWLWRSRMDGAVLGLVLLGISAIFWYGFMLPYGPLLGIAQIVLLILAWKSLT